LLPVTDYLQVKGVEDAARVGDYPADFKPPNAPRSIKIRRLPAPGLLAK